MALLKDCIVGVTEHCLCLFSRLIRVDEGGREQLP